MMKKIFFPFAGAIAFMTMVSCGSGSGDEISDTTSTTTSTDATTGAASADTKSYVDLSTGSTVKVRRDEQSGKYMNAETNLPIEFYFDPVTHDTFDVTGRVVNMAITKGADGKYIVDETKIKFQSDDDVKMKSADGDTKVKLETDGDGKIKTDTSKIKVKDGEVKVKQ